MAAMETLSEAITRLAGAAYVHDFRVDGGQLVCDRCGARFDPSQMTIDQIVRFEGISDPDDQAILYALGTGSGALGLYAAAYGAAASTDDIAVSRALPNPRTPTVDLAEFA
ncbi:MAG: hypothetical protein CL424_16135 [Acidimicrobiaceae bacterium]|nr:hypothetical protein [Acidimicrobiaceae bacterium]